MSIDDLTADNLVDGRFVDLLPEFYELKKFTENNPWHSQQNVFDHVVSVIKNLEKLLQNEKQQWGLSEKIGNTTRKNILVLATVLHDIAKSVTFIKTNDLNTSCPSHEDVGSKMAAKIALRLGFDVDATDRVVKIVHDHGEPHELLNIWKEQNYEEMFQEGRKILTPIWHEAWLLCYADMCGSNLKTINPKEFSRRGKIIQEILNS